MRGFGEARAVRWVRSQDKSWGEQAVRGCNRRSSHAHRSVARVSVILSGDMGNRFIKGRKIQRK